MKTSTPESPKVKEPRSILLIGPPGGGKTSLMLQFPNLAVADCDMNLDGAERLLRKGMKGPKGDWWVEPIPTLSYKHITVPFGSHGTPLHVSECFDYLHTSLDEIKADPEVKTVGVDGLSIINEWIIRKILKQQTRTEMEARDWIPFKSHAMGLINKLRMMGKDTILTCHETILVKTDKKNMMVEEVIGYRPSIQGGITDYFEGFFTDCWRCTLERAPGDKMEAVLTPVKTALSDLKNSLGLPSEIRKVTYENLKPYLEEMK